MVVPKLDRLARSVPDASDIDGTLLACGVRLSLGGSIYAPPTPFQGFQHDGGIRGVGETAITGDMRLC